MNEMIMELNAIFEIYDKIVKSNTELHDLNFDMGLKKKKKTFEIFYARFSATIASLNYSDILKISNLKRLINTRLRYRISEENFSTYKELMTRLRYIAADFETIDKTIPNKDNKSGNDQGSGGVSNQEQNNSSKKGNNNRFDNSKQNSSYQNSGYKYPKSLIDRIVKENRCWKCLKSGHRSGDRNASCKNDDSFNKNQIEIMMKTMGVETVEKPSPSELPGKSEN
ncbi:hypothetical protein IMSHALPRED_005269 [Imshaugia aleurites]|uniref:Uncharacterized protein n=1 Tax=Imshaugia aleurites TaxID=172621 RepID=A0A8H3J8R5_9LECA|nr:hypothetical protein IMSHALPRED_005269 [Imshaugia aleurites]